MSCDPHVFLRLQWDLKNERSMSMSENFAFKLQGIRLGFCHRVLQSCSRYGTSVISRKKYTFSQFFFEINSLFKL